MTAAAVVGLGVVLPIGQSSIVVSPASAVAASDGLFAEAAPTGAKVDSDTVPVELGVRFQPRVAGTVTGAQVYKAVSSSTYTPTQASLWSASGARLATASIAAQRGTGWLAVTFDKPVAVEADATYTVSVFAPNGRYAATNDGFSRQVVNENLRSAPGANGVYRYGSRSAFPTQSYKQSNYWVDVAFAAGTSVPNTPAPTTPVPTTPVPTTPVPTTPVPTTPVPTTPVPTTPATSNGFPTAASTGVPAGTTLSAYTGPMRITTAGTVIDAKQINGTLTIAAANVRVTRSSITGNVQVDSGNLVITDSLIDAGNRPGTGLESSNYVATRVHIKGGNRSAYCAMNCTIQDSYVHGQMTDETGFYHESGIRMEQRTTLIGNTIACDAPTIPPDAGCSAGLTGYGDFAPVRDNLVQGNLFLPSTGGACAYGGASKGKPYSSQSGNIRFIDNVFSRGVNNKCGEFFPITDFDPSAAGNVWQGNKWDDGKVLNP